MVRYKSVILSRIVGNIACLYRQYHHEGGSCGQEVNTPDLEVWNSSFVRRVVSLDNKLYSTLSLFTRCINGYRQHTVGGWPCDGLASHPRGSSNILLGMLHTKETWISSGCLGLWFVCTFTLYLIIEGDFWHEPGQKPKANTINWCYNT